MFIIEGNAKMTTPRDIAGWERMVAEFLYSDKSYIRNLQYYSIAGKHFSQIILDDVEVPQLLFNKNNKLLLLED